MSKDFSRDVIYHKSGLRLSYLGNPLAMEVSIPHTWEKIKMELDSTGQRDRDVCSFFRTSLGVNSGGAIRANAGQPINYLGISFLGNSIQISEIY